MPTTHWVLAATVALGAMPLALGSSQPHDADAGPNTDRIGQPAPEWSFERWPSGGPLRLEALRGKVVLLRWWTDGCHFCEATLPALEKLRLAHVGAGLVVIGVYHPKPPREVNDQEVRAVARKLGFGGPIALDQRWTTLDRYWSDDHPERSWTSVSFLIDRAGEIRWVHGGGEYHPSADRRHARCAARYRDLERALAIALGQTP